MADAPLSDTIARALDLVSAHPAVSHVGTPVLIDGSHTVFVDVTFEVNLPINWRHVGESPSGVKLQEVVRLAFPPGYPLEAPRVSLRRDFNRRLPHIQPWLNMGCPVPCLYDGDLVELLHHEGLAGILNQTAVWLDRAAVRALIDPNQGWEPVRRDGFTDSLFVDAEELRRLVDRKGGFRFLEMEYLRAEYQGYRNIHGYILNPTRKMNSDSVRTLFVESIGGADKLVRRGRSVALAVWPCEQRWGKSNICDIYLPETVSSIVELKKRAELYGCARELENGLDWLKNSVIGYWNEPRSFAIVLLARRPCKVIGSESPIELCPYALDIHPPDLFAQGESTFVRAAAHRDIISRTLLARMAGSAASSERPKWTLVGAGSLGSKLALHLARAGNGPEIVIDKSSISPHNAARHALVPVKDDFQGWLGDKARLLCDALDGLQQKAEPFVGTFESIFTSSEQWQREWSNQQWAVVNATASLVVRETIASNELLSARVIETSLFAGGTVGVITAEGPERNPNTGDLMAEFYAHLQEDTATAKTVFRENGAVSRQRVGQGCGSMTMPMSDGRLSLFAAAMAEYLLRRQSDGLPENGGEVLIGQLSDDGMGLEWHVHPVSPNVNLNTTNGVKWHVHVHQRAEAKIQEETARWPTAETGGVLVGRVSEASHTFHVVDVLDAPEDSHRSASEFVLGMEGLRQKLNSYSEKSGGTLYCLGTWHSHLVESGPSRTDRATAKAVAISRLTPAMLLIHTPAGYRALLADASGIAKGDA